MTSRTRLILLVVVIAAVLGAIALLEGRKVARPSSAGAPEIGIDLDSAVKQAKAARYETAKEVSTPDGFINTDGVTVAELVGKQVILVDFWTYSCINCQRTLPYLESWHEKYGDKGLTIFGVHTPEFEFEKDYGNVSRAVEKWGIEYPVILDNDYSTWTAYRNRYWPRKYLIDIDGFIVYDHIGEGGYEETEAKIVELLNERAERLGSTAVTMDETAPEDVDEVAFEKVGTPEIYFGSSRLQYIANLPSQTCLASSCEYRKPERVALNTFALGGTWRLTDEYAELESGTGSITIRFSASKVNLVAGSNADIPAEIYLDGARIGTETFREHDLYNLVDLKGDYGEHALEIRFTKPGLKAFAFTFG